MLRVPTSTLTDAIPGLVFVKAPGRSTTIREGRSILAALQSCGEVVTFNNIPRGSSYPYQRSDGYYAIFARPQAAEAAVAELPSRVEGLLVYPSSYDRAAHIRRHAHWHHFKPKTNTFIVEDLLKSGAPGAEYADCIGFENPLNIGQRLENARQKQETKTLMNMWKTGKIQAGTS